jgi:hypothetical protein
MLSELHVRNVVRNFGYILLEIKNGREKMVIIQDEDGYKYCVNYHALAAGKKPYIVGSNNPFSLHNIVIWLNKNNCSFNLLPNNEYVSAISRNLHFYCHKCDDIFISSWNCIFEGRGCGVCSGRQVGERHSLAHIRPDLANEWSNKNEILPNEVAPNSNKRAWWICSKCSYGLNGEWFVPPCDRMSGTGCPACSGRVPTNIDNLIVRYPEALCFWDYSNNDKSPNEYRHGSKKEVYWLCENNRHDSYLRSVEKAVRFEFRCPECVRERTESFLQEKVRRYLYSIDELSINHEESCTIVPVNPKTGAYLPFDNEVEELRLIIEVNGEHHFRLNSWHNFAFDRNGMTPEESLEYQQWKDNYKKEYAISQGYYYLEIPYWYDDEQETWKQAIDEMIEYILEQEGGNN